jgi:hypothetical protein
MNESRSTRSGGNSKSTFRKHKRHKQHKKHNPTLGKPVNGTRRTGSSESSSRTANVQSNYQFACFSISCQLFLSELAVGAQETQAAHTAIRSSRSNSAAGMRLYSTLASKQFS